MIRGTATYTFKSGGQDKLDFKLQFKSSKFMVAETEGLTELLSQGVLEHASSLTKMTGQSSLNFDQILAKLTGLNFAVVERVDNTAYMHAKTMKSQHSVAFLIKHNENKGCLVVDGKATNPNILASLTDEIRDMDLLWSYKLYLLEWDKGQKGVINEYNHSALMSNQTKVWKTKTGPLQGDKACSRDPESALFGILKNKEHFY